MSSLALLLALLLVGCSAEEPTATTFIGGSAGSVGFTDEVEPFVTATITDTTSCPGGEGCSEFTLDITADSFAAAPVFLEVNETGAITYIDCDYMREAWEEQCGE